MLFATRLKCYQFSFLRQWVNSFFEILQWVCCGLRLAFRLGITRAAGRVRSIEVGTGIRRLCGNQPKAARLAGCGLRWTFRLGLLLCLLQLLSRPLELLLSAVI